MSLPTSLGKLGLFAVLAALASSCDYSKTGRSEKYSAHDQSGITVNLPANAPVISQQFRHLTHDKEAMQEEGTHFGIDVVFDFGTPVLAAAPGRITRSYFEPFFGNTMVVEHGEDDTGKRLRTYYRHLQQRIGKVGDVVQRGQQIATLGATGTWSGGFPHLHFEVHRHIMDQVFRPVDPHLLWANGVGNVTCFTSDHSLPDAPVRTTYPVPCVTR